MEVKHHAVPRRPGSTKAAIPIHKTAGMRASIGSLVQPPERRRAIQDSLTPRKCRWTSAFKPVEATASSMHFSTLQINAFARPASRPTSRWPTLPWVQVRIQGLSQERPHKIHRPTMPLSTPVMLQHRLVPETLPNSVVPKALAISTWTLLSLRLQARLHHLTTYTSDATTTSRLVRSTSLSNRQALLLVRPTAANWATHGRPDLLSIVHRQAPANVGRKSKPVSSRRKVPAVITVMELLAPRKYLKLCSKSIITRCHSRWTLSHDMLPYETFTLMRR